MEVAMDVGAVRAKLLEVIRLRGKYVPCASADENLTKTKAEKSAESRVQRGPPYTPSCTDSPAAVSQLDEPDSAAMEEVRYEFKDGLMDIRRVSDGSPMFDPVPSINEFYDDMHTIFHTRTDGAVSTFCYHRLKLLQMKFELYSMVNFDLETNEQNGNPHRDFYNVRKVDTHVHHSAAMNGKHLLRFIKRKLKKFPDDVVQTEHGKPVQLQDVFQKLKIKAEELSLDRLNVLADKSTLHRFDRFNSKYSPLGNPVLRTVFLKTDNEMGGRYLAELTRELLDDLEESKYQHAEWRLSIYGRDRKEWSKLSKWVIGHKLISENNMWMIQIPRLYSVYKSAGQIQNFQDMLDNIFLPLYEVTLNPNSNPELHAFLKQVSGFDSVDDESKSEAPVDRKFSSKSRTPASWDIHDNPSYKYYNYYLQSNIRILNRLRASRGLTQFHYRPHAGEAGETHHLDTAFLLADGISHGINLRRSMGLQYLFYLCQIPMAMSPCSNNQLFLSYEKHPFHEFFKRGLCLSLSTDDPLMFHQTKEPLMEEYSIAKQLWRLTGADLCELARNSVLHSGFPKAMKEQWLGTSSYMTKNVIQRTNVPDLRIHFRQRCLADEMLLLRNDGVDTSALSSAFPMSPRSLGLGGPTELPAVSPKRLRPQDLLEGFKLEVAPSEAAERLQQFDSFEVDSVRGLGTCCSVDMIGELVTGKSPRTEPNGLASRSHSPAKRRRLMGTVSLGAAIRQCKEGQEAPAEDPFFLDAGAGVEIAEVDELAKNGNSAASKHHTSPPRLPIGLPPIDALMENGAASNGAAANGSAVSTASHPSLAMDTSMVVNAFGTTGLLKKLLADFPYDTVLDLAGHLLALHQKGVSRAASTPAVAEAWREAVLNTKEYHAVCEHCFGRIIHHSTPQSPNGAAPELQANGRS